MYIYEIFYGVEGEGIRIGTPQIFVRTVGCSIRCDYCDSKHTWVTNPNFYMSMDTIVDIINCLAGKTIKWVSITGGNPLEQEYLLLLVSMLHGKDYKVNLESPGIEDHNVHYMVDFVSFDIKTPCAKLKNNAGKLLSDEELANIAAFIIPFWKDHRDTCQIKAVVKTKQDLDFLDNYVPRDINLILTPCITSKLDTEFINVVVNYLNDKPFWRLIAQQHKFLSIS